MYNLIISSVRSGQGIAIEKGPYTLGGVKALGVRLLITASSALDIYRKCVCDTTDY